MLGLLGLLRRLVVGRRRGGLGIVSEGLLGDVIVLQVHGGDRQPKMLLINEMFDEAARYNGRRWIASKLSQSDYHQADGCNRTRRIR